MSWKETTFNAKKNKDQRRKNRPYNTAINSPKQKLYRERSKITIDKLLSEEANGN